MLRLLTAGESHGPCLLAIVEGLPAGLLVDEEAINADLRRRQGGYGRGERMQIERDQAEILSGVWQGHTTGAPVALCIFGGHSYLWGLLALLAWLREISNWHQGENML